MNLWTVANEKSEPKRQQWEVPVLTGGATDDQGNACPL